MIGGIVGSGGGASRSAMILGSGLATGNTITKTVNGAGGADFTTLQEVFEWLNGNTFNGVGIIFNIAAGTYNLNFLDTGWSIYTGGWSGVHWLSFEGVDSATCIVEADEEYIFVIENCDISFSDLTFVSTYDSGAGGGTLFFQRSGRLNISWCVFKEWYVAVEMRNGFTALWACGVNNTVYSGGTFLYHLGGDVVMYGFTGTDLNDGWFIYGSDMLPGSIVVKGPAVSINNAAEGFTVHAGLQVYLNVVPSFTNCDSEYSIPLNEIQGDGSYITNGGPLTLAT